MSRSRSPRLDEPKLGDQITARVKEGLAKIERFIDDAKRRKQDETGSARFGYVKALIDDRAVAALHPSSKFIVDRVVKAVGIKDARVIVEYGAAQGVITKRLLERARPDAKILAIEFNDALFQDLRKLDDPRLVPVRGDVREIDAIMKRHGFGAADAIVSGVPFSFFTGRQRHELLLKTSDALRPGGRFVAYQVTTHLIPMLRDYFRKVDTQFEVRNIPPHFVFTATK